MNLDELGLKRDLATLARLVGEELDDLEVEVLPAPHIPPSSLPRGRQAVYAFFLGDVGLKVGKAGPGSSARYTSHHYRLGGAGKRGSTLADSILKAFVEAAGNPELPMLRGVNELSPDTVAAWIKENTTRVNVLIPSRLPRTFLYLLEAFLQCRWEPYFEGRRRTR